MSISKIPNFYIIGAPKCGTTSLAVWLSEHPNIFISKIKEPHFFNTDGLVATKSLDDYKKLFNGVSDHHIAVGEASTRYLFSKNAIKNINNHNPNSKFIICLRNPIEMVRALHSERVSQGTETLKSFESAWRAQQERADGKNLTKFAKQDPDLLQYGKYCLLGEQLSRTIKRIKSDRILTIVLDDMKTDPKETYENILKFLEVTSDGRNHFPVYNKNKQTKSVFVAQILRILRAFREKNPIEGLSSGLLVTIKKKNTTISQRERIDSNLKSELIDYFRKDIELVQNILNRDLSNWLA